MARDGRTALVEQLIADGVAFMFGNPGTVEQGFLDIMRSYSDQIEYVFALQESIAVAIADGYARASGGLGVVQLHSSAGLGNGMGGLYQAFRGHTPLLVLAGDAGVCYDAMDSQMAADLVAMARPVTKYATRATDRHSLLRVIRRAIKIALTPPTGPVFVGLPMDVLDQECEEDVRRSCYLDTRTRPTERTVQEIAAALGASERPLIVVGDGVSASGAQEELERVALALGAEVWGANSSEVNLRSSSPLNCGLFGHMFGFQSEPHTRNADTVLICGTYIFPEVFPELRESAVFDERATVIHVDLDSYEIAKNFRVDIGVVSDPKETLGLIADVLETRMTAEQKEAAAARCQAIGARNRGLLADAREKDTVAATAVPPPLAVFARELIRRLPGGAIVFDEALTCSPELMRYFDASEPSVYHQARGGSLGLGIPGAIGAKLANPDRIVLGFTGDGGSLYTIQALWTAAHHHVGAKFVICNNQSYRLLKWNLDEYRKERNELRTGYPDSFDIHDPAPAFVDIAKGFGVAAERVDRLEQFEGAIGRSLANDEPYLIDVAVAR